MHLQAESADRLLWRSTNLPPIFIISGLLEGDAYSVIGFSVLQLIIPGNALINEAVVYILVDLRVNQNDNQINYHKMPRNL